MGNEWRLYKGEKYIRCSDCGVLIKQTAKNKKYCKDCVKENQYYEQIGTKIIKCVDCGIDVTISSLNTKTCRCDSCLKKYRNKYQRELMRKRNLA